MNYSLLKLYLENPERAREVAHGLELSACAFQSQIIRKGILNVGKWRGLLRNARFVNPDERNFGLEVAAANFNAQIRKLETIRGNGGDFARMRKPPSGAKPPDSVEGSAFVEAVSRDRHGHFYKPDGAACPHSDGGGKQHSQKPQREKKLKMPDGFEPVPIKTVYERIGNNNSETVIAADGKPARFSKVGIRHFKGKGFEKQIRLQSLDVAIDTVKTGYFYESIIPNSGGMVQTEFIKKYGKKYYYTARRKDSGEIYSWHGLEDWQYNKKMKAYKAYNETGKIQ